MRDCNRSGAAQRRNSLQEYPVSAGVPHRHTFFSLLYINDLSDDVVCDIAI